MNRMLAWTGALVVLGLLAGCGGGSTPRVEPDVATEPTWGECQVLSNQFIDYVAGAPGVETAEAAMARYREADDHVVVVPAHDHQARQWLLVDGDDTIHASLGMSHTEHGWLVDSVQRCAE